MQQSDRVNSCLESALGYSYRSVPHQQTCLSLQKYNRKMESLLEGPFDIRGGGGAGIFF